MERRAGGPHIAIVGDIFCDIVIGGLARLPIWQEDVTVPEPIQLLAGGGALNAAVQVDLLQRKSGGVVDLHSLIGRDALGDVIKRRLARTSIRLFAGRASATTRTGSCVCLSGAKDRAFVTYRGAVAELSGRHLDMKALASANHIHVAGYYNCPKLWGDLEDLFENLRHGGATLSLNPQFDASGLWQGLSSIYKKLDFAVLNELEAARLSGRDTLGAAVTRLHELGLRRVVVTLGARGAFCSEGSGCGDSDTKHRRWFWQSAARALVRDTTGAGDAFAAGFVYEWARTRDTQASLSLGCTLGTAMVTKLGASVAISEADLKAASCVGMPRGQCRSEGAVPTRLIGLRLV